MFTKCHTWWLTKVLSKEKLSVILAVLMVSFCVDCESILVGTV